MSLDVHTDGSAMWLNCQGCGVTVIEFWSLPVPLAEMTAPTYHRCDEGVGNGEL